MVETKCVILEDSKNIKNVKSALEKLNWLDKSTKIMQDPSTKSFHLPISTGSDIDLTQLEQKLSDSIPNVKFKVILRSIDDEYHSKSNGNTLQSILSQITENKELVLKLVNSFPKKYSIYTPLLLLPPKSLESEEWTSILNDLDNERKQTLFKSILDIYSTPSSSLTHLAINKPIPESDNIIRSPVHLTMLYGDFNNFWCHTVQNGIYQTWMPIHTMFSRGNIKEKSRILSLNNESYSNINYNTDVIDMYAGIGYFTLSYLKRGARRVYCWEINEYSVEGLIRGVKKNKFGECYLVKRNENIDYSKLLKARCVIFLESNEYCIDRVDEMINLGTSFNISHINLGLLPTSVDSWPYTCKLLDNYGDKSSSWIHVHENIGTDEIEDFMDKTNDKLQSMLYNKKITPIWLEKVKTFAPDVYHIVGDFKLIEKN